MSAVAIRVAMALALLALGVSVAIASEDADSTGDGSPRAEVVAAGENLEISDSLSGAAVVTGTDLAPGDTITGNVTVGNAGTVPGVFSLSSSNLTDTPGPNGGALSSALDLIVEDLTAGKVIYIGKLKTLGHRALGTWQPGQLHDFRFTASLRDNGPAQPMSGDNLYQDANSTFRLDWNATAPPSFTPNPGGGGGGGEASRLQLTVAGKSQRLRRGRVAWTVSCNVACAVKTQVSVNGRKGKRMARRLFKPSIKRVNLRPAKKTTVRIKFTRAQIGKIKRALKRRQEVSLSLKATATTAGGATTTGTTTLQIKR